MRTTIDIPDELYRTLKTRAALRGTTLRELVQELILRGLDSVEPGGRSAQSSERPPVAIPGTGKALPLLTQQEIKDLEEEEDIERHGRLA